MSVHNPPDVSTRVSDRLRPVWSWGANSTEAGPQTAPPESGGGAPGAPTLDPPTIELVGRAVERPSWAWGGRVAGCRDHAGRARGGGAGG